MSPDTPTPPEGTIPGSRPFVVLTRNYPVKEPPSPPSPPTMPTPPPSPAPASKFDPENPMKRLTIADLPPPSNTTPSKPGAIRHTARLHVAHEFNQADYDAMDADPRSAPAAILADHMRAVAADLLEQAAKHEAFAVDGYIADRTWHADRAELLQGIAERLVGWEGGAS